MLFCKIDCSRKATDHPEPQALYIAALALLRARDDAATRAQVVGAERAFSFGRAERAVVLCAARVSDERNVSEPRLLACERGNEALVNLINYSERIRVGAVA